MRVSFPIIEIILIAVVTVLTAYNSLFSLGFLLILILEVLRERKLDEMERYHRLEASLLTLYAVISVTVVLFVLSIELNNDVLFLYTLFPLMLKNMLAAGRSWERKRVILVTGLSISVILLAFTLLSHGFSLDTLIESIMPVIFLTTTLIALKWRRTGSILYLLVFLSLTVLIFRNGVNLGKIITFTLLGVPTIFLSVQSLKRD